MRTIPQRSFPKTVDLGGDTNLLAGPQGRQIRIRVSKALLSFASKYFNALFSPKFKEGGVAVLGEDVVLAEDEPEALVNLFKILHMQYTAPKPMGSTDLLHLGIVADKYGCVKAIQLAVEALFPPVNMFSPVANDICATRDLVVAAYLLDHPAMFHQYTRSIFTNYSHSLTVVALSDVGQRMPVAAWLELETRRSKVLSGIISSIVILLKRPCTAEFRNCVRTGDWYSKVTLALKNAGLEDPNAAKNTAARLLQMAERITIPPVNSNLTQCGTVVHVAPPGQSYHPLPMSQERFTALLKECRAKCQGLCLDCVRAGKKLGSGCRIQHD